MDIDGGTKAVLESLPLGDESPCTLTEEEREAVTLFMACDDLGDLADSEPWQIVYTLRYRFGLCAPRAATLPPIGQFRFGPIAHAVIAHVKHELEQRTATNAPVT